MRNYTTSFCYSSLSNVITLESFSKSPLVNHRYSFLIEIILTNIYLQNCYYSNNMQSMSN